VGEVEKEDNVMILKRIHVTYTLRVADEHRATAQRVHGFHARFCPVARSIGGSVAITTELRLEEIV